MAVEHCGLEVAFLWYYLIISLPKIKVLLVLIEERKHLAKLPNLIVMLCLRSEGLTPHIHMGLKVRFDIKPNASGRNFSFIYSHISESGVLFYDSTGN